MKHRLAAVAMAAIGLTLGAQRGDVHGAQHFLLGAVEGQPIGIRAAGRVVWSGVSDSPCISFHAPGDSEILLSLYEPPTDLSDLRIRAIEYSPSPPICGAMETRGLVENVGTRPASNVVTVAFLDGIEVGRWTMPSLDAGSARPTPWAPLGNLGAGSYVVLLWVDPDGLIHEADEDNNTR